MLCIVLILIWIILEHLGQAGAIRLGIARALLSFNEGFKDKLDERKSNGCE